MALHVPVLVIEEDRVFQKTVAKMLVKARYMPIVSDTPQRAILDSDGVDIVVTDINFSGPDDADGIGAIRKRNPKVRIIATSGGWDGVETPHILSDARKRGADWALKKPFNADQLNEAIACVLGGERSEPAEPPSGPEIKLNVVVVDDDKLSGTIVSKHLRSHTLGRVEHVGQGQAVLDLIGSDETPDLILVDLKMPGMDGPTLLRHLGEAGYDGGICLISGESRQVLKTAGLLAKSNGLNVVGTLSKPVKAADVDRIIAAATEAKPDTSQESESPISEADIRQAIAEGRTECHYQPIISMKTEEVVAVESLVRWRHPSMGLLFPNSFLPFVLQHGLVDLLLDATMVETAEAIAAWDKSGLRISASVNLPEQSFQRLDLPDFLATVATQNGLDPDRFILEIGGSGAISDTAQALEILTRMRLAGFGLSFDDFGAGQTSLNRLEDTPVTELKVARVLVAGAGEDPERAAILRTSVDLAKRLDLKTVAKGVETPEDWDFAKQLGFDYVQGYFITKPLPAEDFPRWHHAWKFNRG